MQFHVNGFEPGDPRMSSPAAARAAALPVTPCRRRWTC